jgi:hypothetical protein
MARKTNETQEAMRLYSCALTGGFSVQSTSSGEFAHYDASHGGFAVSLPNYERIVPQCDRQAFADAFAELEQIRLNLSGSSVLWVGGWLHDGKIYLDISAVYETEGRAIYEAVKAQQLAYYDYGKGEVIAT